MLKYRIKSVPCSSNGELVLLSTDRGGEEMVLNKMGPPSAHRCVCLWWSDEEPGGGFIRSR